MSEPDQAPSLHSNEREEETEEEDILFWEWPDLRKAYERLIFYSDLPTKTSSLPGAPDAENVLRALQWVRRAPRAMGLDVREEPVTLESLCMRFMELIGPTLTLIELEGGVLVIAAIFEPGSTVRVVGPSGQYRVSRSRLYDLTVDVVVAGSESLEALFGGLPSGDAVYRRLLAGDAFGGDQRHIQLFRFELDGAHPIADQLSALGAWRALGSHLAISVVQSLISFAALWTLGSSISNGQIDVGRVVGWTLLAASDAPLQYVSSKALADFSAALGASIKKRLLEGTFFISDKQVRAKGTGELIALTTEISVVEQLSLAEVSGAVLAIFQVAAAFVLLLFGAQRSLACAALGLCIVASAIIVRENYRSYRASFYDRIGLTDDLVEKIIGHRTRAVQENPKERHGQEDLALTAYARNALYLDRVKGFATTMPRVWLALGAGVILFAFVVDAQRSDLIYSALGVLLGYRAFLSFFPSATRIAELWTAWRGADSLVSAGQERERASERVGIEADSSDLPTVLSMSAVSFAHRSGGRTILQDTNLQIRLGEKVLLEGASGSGKTTLLKLIAGESAAASGVILVNGTDRFAVSEFEWRRRVASAPQFHDNHVFSNTLAFNLDPWGEPGIATPEAIAICNELGLAPLIQRMPQAFAQVLGETGWQLSHGERSRLFIARALLQKADLLLFDENFGALDPETLIQALECVRRRAKTMIVIAHT